MFNRLIKISLGALLLAAMSQVAAAPIITGGLTFAVADSPDPDIDLDMTGVGTHFHSNGPPGQEFFPGGSAEVGNFTDEEVRGLSEFDVSALSSSNSAILTFDASSGGLFDFPGIPEADENNFPFDDFVDIFAYEGNNTEDYSDFEITSGLIGSFSTSGLGPGPVGAGFNVFNIYQQAINSSWSSLGFRLSRRSPTTDGGAWVFTNFQLTTNDEDNPSVPEPGTLFLLAFGLFGLCLARYKLNPAAIS